MAEEGQEGRHVWYRFEMWCGFGMGGGELGRWLIRLRSKGER